MKQTPPDDVWNIFENAPYPFVATDEAGAVVEWNPEAARRLGWSRDEALGSELSGLIITSSSRDAYLEALEAARAGDGDCGDYVGLLLADREGQAFPAQVALWVTPAAEPSHFFCLSVHDRPYRLPRDRQFLANAAHQLRTPIAGIRLAAENLLIGVDVEDQHRLLANLVRETTRASRLIAQLLLAAEIDERQPMSTAPCDPVELCSAEIDRAWSLAPDLDFSLQADDLPVGTVELDAEAVQEVLANVLDNARRHARQRIDVVIERSGDDLAVRIDDDGPGVPDGWEHRIFERFVSLGERAGSGLGLAIARELAQAHGGDLSYDSGGFLLRLPIPSWAGNDVDADG